MDYGAATGSECEFFVSQGIPHPTEADAEKIWSHHCIEPEDYDKTMSKDYWSDCYEMEDSPAPHRLPERSMSGLTDILVAGRNSNFTRATRIPATSVSGSMPSDQLSLSPLQARLIELGMPIKIVEGT